MPNTNTRRYATACVGLGACGEGSKPSGPGSEGFDFTADLIAFRSDRDGQQEIYLTTTGGAHSINVTKHAAEDDEPAWSADGSKITFTSDPEGGQLELVRRQDYVPEPPRRRLRDLRDALRWLGPHNPDRPPERRALLILVE